jgi:hypothetical protein
MDNNTIDYVIIDMNDHELDPFEIAKVSPPPEEEPEKEPIQIQQWDEEALVWG